MNIKIEKAVFGGYGLGHIDGKACFVPYSVPGDELSIEIYKDKRNYSYGKIHGIINKSDRRIDAECPNFGICGGCDHLNISYEDELKLKKEILVDALRKTNPGLELIPNISIISGQRFHYRSHASVKYHNQTGFGFYERYTNNIIGLPDKGCMLLADGINSTLAALKKQNSFSDGNDLIFACDHKGDCYYSHGMKDIIITERENAIVYEREICLFFQANLFLRGKMLDIVKNYACLTPDEKVCDIGCGVGFFALCLAKECGTIYGVDTSRNSIKWAKHNAAINEINNAVFLTMPASGIREIKVHFDAVIADPPRTGMSSEAADALIAVSPSRIVYVSCNPAAFARDAKHFMSNNYSLDKLTLIDMFPGTHHIETIGLFSKSAN